MKPKEIVLEMYGAFDKGEFDRVRSIMSDEFIADLVGVPAPLDLDAFIQFGREFQLAFPDSCHQYKLATNPDRSCVVSTVTTYLLSAGVKSSQLAC